MSEVSNALMNQGPAFCGTGGGGSDGTPPAAVIQPAPFIPGLEQQARAMQGVPAVPCWCPIKAGDAVPDGVSTVLIEAADYAAYRAMHEEMLSMVNKLGQRLMQARADTRQDAFPARALRGGDGVFLG